MDLHLTVDNFKSISTTELHLKTGLNILIGPNGSGKTCLLSSLNFIRDLFIFGAAQAMARNGGARRVYRRQTNKISFSITHDYGERLYRRKKWPCKLSWEISISQRGREKIATIIWEQLSINATVRGRKRTLFQFSTDRTKLSEPIIKCVMSEPSNFGRDLFSWWSYQGNSSKEKLYEDTNEILRDIVMMAKKNSEITIFSLLSFLDEKTEEVFNSFFYLNEYSISPDIARLSTEQLPFAQMQPNGAGVSEVIQALESRNYDRLRLGRYYEREQYINMDLMSYRRRNWRYIVRPRALFGYRGSRPMLSKFNLHMINTSLENINGEMAAAVKPIDSVSFRVDPSNGRRFVIFKAGEEVYYPEEVSDGTIKWLCILVSIFIPFSYVYLLEEPENFLHPWMQQRLIEIMRENSEKSDIIFLLASHSTTILNSANPEEILVVRSTNEGTKINEIEDKEEIKLALMESEFRLGDLWVSGAIGGVPHDE